MKKLFGAFLSIILLTQLSIAGSYFETGLSLSDDAREWNKYYQGDKDFSIHDVSHFQGYVVGVLDAHGGTIGTPEGFTVDQACAIVAKYLRDHPERLNEEAATLVQDALRDAYNQ